MAQGCAPCMLPLHTSLPAGCVRCARACTMIVIMKHMQCSQVRPVLC